MLGHSVVSIVVEYDCPCVPEGSEVLVMLKLGSCCAHPQHANAISPASNFQDFKSSPPVNNTNSTSRSLPPNNIRFNLLAIHHPFEIGLPRAADFLPRPVTGTAYRLGVGTKRNPTTNHHPWRISAIVGPCAPKTHFC
jgi:hypothetical protein